MMRLKFHIGDLIVVLGVMVTIIDEFIVTILGFVVGVIIGIEILDGAIEGATECGCVG